MNMNRQRTGWSVAIALVAGVALVGAAFGAPQHAEHEAAQAVGEEGAPEAGQMQTCPMAEQMMGAMHQHMAMMQRMMAHMHGDEGAEMQGPGMMGEAGPRPGHGTPGGHAMMGGHGMMGQMGHGAMVDPASIDDPNAAVEAAQRLDSMVERMKSHVTKMQERADALRQRAEELRRES